MVTLTHLKGRSANVPYAFEWGKMSKDVDEKNVMKIKRRHIKASKKKNLSFLQGMDRQICPSATLVMPNCDRRDIFVYPPLTLVNVRFLYFQASGLILTKFAQLNIFLVKRFLKII